MFRHSLFFVITDLFDLGQECSFCEDPRFARTGVCISCDAGMCRAYFHVTCAQKEGLLSEAAAEEVRRLADNLHCKKSWFMCLTPEIY